MEPTRPHKHHRQTRCWRSGCNVTLGTDCRSFGAQAQVLQASPGGFQPTKLVHPQGSKQICPPDPGGGKPHPSRASFSPIRFHLQATASSICPPHPPQDISLVPLTFLGAKGRYACFRRLSNWRGYPLDLCLRLTYSYSPSQALGILRLTHHYNSKSPTMFPGTSRILTSH